MDQTYDFVLDLFPLSETIENDLLARRLQESALDLLLGGQKKDEVGLLLRICYDLGHLDAEVLAYLEKQLRKL